MPTELTDSSFASEVLQHPATVLVDFYTPSCAPCRMLQPILDEIAAERMGSLKVVKLDAWQHSQTVAQFRVAAVPSLLLFKGGEVAKQRTGLCSKKDLLAWIDSAG